MEKTITLIFFIFTFLTVKGQNKEEPNQRCFSMVELIANSEKHENEMISTTGVFKYSGGDKGVLYLSKDDAKYNITKNAFIVYFSNENLKDLNLKIINNDVVTIIGYFSATNKGYLNYFDGSISGINYIESLDDLLIEKQYIEVQSNKTK